MEEPKKRLRSLSDLYPPRSTQVDLLSLSQNVKDEICQKYQLRHPVSQSFGDTPQEEALFQSTYVQFFNDIVQLAGRQDLNLELDKTDEFTLILLYRCWDRKELGIFEPRLNKAIEDYEEKVSRHSPQPETAKAIIDAWDTPYVGETDKLLWKAILAMYKSKDYRNGNFCAIIQGSGSGKSRMVDQLAKSVFTIPFVFCPQKYSTAYSTGDTTNDGTPVLDYFTVKSTSEWEKMIHRRHLLMLLKAINYLGEWIDNWKRENPDGDVKNAADDWRQYLGRPGEKNINRRQFFTQVTDENVALAGFEDIITEQYNDDVERKARQFIHEVCGKISSEASRPLIIFYFDDAHHLLAGLRASPTYEGPNRTAYQCLCKAFTYMIKTPIFLLVISAFQHLREFSPSPITWSYRGDAPGAEENVHAPFVELPFDRWHSAFLVREGQHSLEEISSLRFMARFGRPLFWTIIENIKEGSEIDIIEDVMKLAVSKMTLHIKYEPDHEIALKDSELDAVDTKLLPALVARIDLTLESNRDAAVYLDKVLVANTFRTVYSVPQHFQFMYAGYSSEPFVAEAASRVIYNHFLKEMNQHLTDSDSEAKRNWMIDRYKDKIPRVVLKYFEAGLIKKDAREALIARTLIMQARDFCVLSQLSGEDFEKDNKVSFSRKISVIEYLRQLIPEEHIEKVLKATPWNMQGQTLMEAFEGAYVNFSHFIKGKDGFITSDQGLYFMFTRGGVVDVHESSPDVDFAIPVCMPPGTEHPTRWTMTAIFFQVKSHLLKQTNNFDAADKTFGCFTPSSNSVANSRPYITIVMQFGADPGWASDTEEQSARKGKKRTIRHPGYEFTIIGSSHKVYNVVREDSMAYKPILGYQDILSEHPQTLPELHDAVLGMKPCFKKGSFGWASLEGSRIGADGSEVSEGDSDADGPGVSQGDDEENDHGELEETIEVNTFVAG